MTSTHTIRNPWLFIIILFATTLGQISSDLYTPALPQLTHLFHTSHRWVQFSLALFLAGYGLSQLIYGVLSDQFGRKRLLMIGLLIASIGSLLCAGSQSIGMLILGRLVQGSGVGAALVLGRALLRDAYSGNRLACYHSYIEIPMPLILCTAPIIGGYLVETHLWRMGFFGLSLHMLLLLILISTCMPREVGKLATIEKTTTYRYADLLQSPIFLRYVLLACCTYAGISAYIAISPFLFENALHLSAKAYGWLAAYSGAALMLGSILNAQGVRRFGYRRMLPVGFLLMLISGLSLLCIAFFFPGASLWMIMLPVMGFMMSTMFVFSNCYAGAFSPYPGAVGKAAALFGGAQMLAGGIGGTMSAYLPTQTAVGVGIVFLMVGITGMIFVSKDAA